MLTHCCPSSPLNGPIGRAKLLKTRAPVAIAETRPPVLADAVQIGAGLATAIGRDPRAQLKPSRRRSRHPEAPPSATRDHGAVQVAIRRNLIWTRVMLTILNLPDLLRRVRTETRPDRVPTQGRPAPPPLHRAPRRVDRTRRSESEDTRRRDPRGVRAAPPDVHVPGHLNEIAPDRSSRVSADSFSTSASGESSNSSTPQVSPQRYGESGSSDAH